MTKKNLCLLAFVAGLAAVYAAYFTDWFKPKTLVINYTVRNLPPRLQRKDAQPLLMFIFNSPLKFTEIKVVPFDGFQTNRNVVPLWHLVSDSNSAPMKTFSYGDYGHMIHGMRPAIKGVRAELLATNVTYRLLVTAGKIKGEHDFELK